MKNKTFLGIIYMALSGLFFGGVRFFSKQIIQDIAPLTFTTLRMLIALTILALFWRKFLPKIKTIAFTDRKRIAIAAICWMVLMAISFTLSVKRTTVTNSSFLFFIPWVLLPIGWALFANLKIKASTYAAVWLCIIWLYSLFDPEIVGTSLIWNLFGLLAVVGNVIYILTIKRVSHLSPKLLGIATFIILVLSLILITIVFEWNQLWDINWGTWEIIWYIWVCIAWAYLFMNMALQHLSSYLTSLLAIREPLAATALWVLFLWEILTTSAFIWLWAILLWFGLISMDKGLMK